SRWRGEELPLPGGGLLVNDCYNANPVSMRAALGLLADRAEGRRRVAILGDMAELGPDGPRYHREVGAAAAELGVDVLVPIAPLAVSKYKVPALTVLFVTLACGAIGFLDDFIKLTHKRSLGLNARWKLVLLALITVGVAVAARHQHLPTWVLLPIVGWKVQL